MVRRSRVHWIRLQTIQPCVVRQWVRATLLNGVVEYHAIVLATLFEALPTSAVWQGRWPHAILPSTVMVCRQSAQLKTRCAMTNSSAAYRLVPATHLNIVRALPNSAQQMSHRRTVHRATMATLALPPTNVYMEDARVCGFASVLIQQNATISMGAQATHAREHAAMTPLPSLAVRATMEMRAR